VPKLNEEIPTPWFVANQKPRQQTRLHSQSTATTGVTSRTVATTKSNALPSITEIPAKTKPRSKQDIELAETFKKLGLESMFNRKVT
jgi:hypothetical protein